MKKIIHTFNHICILAPGSGTSNLVSGGAFIAMTVCSSNDFILLISWYVTYAYVGRLRNKIVALTTSYYLDIIFLWPFMVISWSSRVNMEGGQTTIHRVNHLSAKGCTG